MANPTAYALNQTINPEGFLQDGYVCLGSDGYTIVSSLPVNSIIKSFTHVSTGVWQCILQECWPAPVVSAFNSPVLRFEITPVYTSNPGTSKVAVVQTGDNIASNTTPGSGIINFVVLNSSGSVTDFPVNGGFRFSIRMQQTNLYL
jgi:hypothetical protein